MTNEIILNPLLPLILIALVALLSGTVVAVALYRRLSGWWLRGLAGIVLVTALLNPSLQQEERVPLSDIVIVVVDESSSQSVSDRSAQNAQAIANIEREITRLPNTELRISTITDGEGDSGTQLMQALSEALADEPKGRIAGAILVTDGRLHDLESAPQMPAPLHALITGQPDDWDRRLVISNAPAFAILGESVVLTLRIEDQGAAPVVANTTPLSISIDGGEPLNFEVEIGRDIELPVTLPHGGMNVLQFEIPTQDGELTSRNNSAVVQINGVRDRLRVLLVSGEPHAGERTWRNLLKADASVDLVHFTILRPPEKQDGVPVNELSLIAFPTRELFLEKIDDFDLIIFDRYRRRGILPSQYLDNVVSYVVEGGAVLVAAGPEYGGAESIYRSPLGAIIPGAPTARVFERGYKPSLTEVGERHPVTEGLEGPSTESSEDGPNWGRWFRLVDVEVPSTATTVMTGIDERPLLSLERIGEGRVALLASDHSWLWDRGYEGGGPQAELLRRLAHWMMKEPELEEEALWVEPNGQSMRVIRRTLNEEAGTVTITHPDGTETELTLQQVSPGRYETLWDAPSIGLYRLKDDEKEAVIALGPAAPREFEQTIATDELLAPILDASNGGTISISEGEFAIRTVRPGRPAIGRGWLGITPRDAFESADISISPLLPSWAFLLLAASFVIGAWMREGRS